MLLAATKIGDHLKESFCESLTIEDLQRLKNLLPICEKITILS
jgi:hypothetical protein